MPSHTSQIIFLETYAFLYKQAWSFVKKETPTQMFSCEFLRIPFLQNNFPPVAASAVHRIKLTLSKKVQDKINPLSTNPQNGQIHSNNLSVTADLFDHFVRLTLKGLSIEE